MERRYRETDSNTVREELARYISHQPCPACGTRLNEAARHVLVGGLNVDVIKTADWVIDLGPEGGDKGGEIVAVGAPEQIAADPRSHPGRFLRPLLERGW